MKILLCANHRNVVGFNRVARIPNLGIASIAGNLDRDKHTAKTLDLAVAREDPYKVFEKVLHTFAPDVVGLSAMIFQVRETVKLAKILKQMQPDTPVVLGGYLPTVLAEEVLRDYPQIDYIIRGEGEPAFAEFLDALENALPLNAVQNLSFRENGQIVHNKSACLVELEHLQLPDRRNRVLTRGFHLFGKPADVMETSRGCTHTCNFCSINKMYGRTFRTYSIKRVLEDIRDAASLGAEAMLITDDNITLDGKRCLELFSAVAESELSMEFCLQASVQGLLRTPGLAKTMVRAGAKWIFLGIENESDDSLSFIDKDNQLKSSDAYGVIRELKAEGAIIIGGFILGLPDDTESSLWSNYNYAMRLGVDIPVFHLLTPYPGTRLREELLEQGYVTNTAGYADYTCYHANVRTKHLSSDELFKIRNRMDGKYLIQSGALWRLLRRHPSFLPKLIVEELFNRPGTALNFLRGIFPR